MAIMLIVDKHNPSQLCKKNWADNDPQIGATIIMPMRFIIFFMFPEQLTWF